MRIIAGEFRGRKLLPPQGEVTRPITDRVKQSVFDILAPHIPGAFVMDLFAGTGSMGLECLSRGAAAVDFYEADRSGVARLKKNIRILGLPVERYGVTAGDLFAVFKAWDAFEVKEVRQADLVFLDPPYRFLRERPDDLRRLAGELWRSWVHPDSVVVFRHDALDRLALPGFAVADERKYGGMTVEFLRPVELSEPRL
jgi:16S rRNA (guanine966-N2)-methyltransferase